MHKEAYLELKQCAQDTGKCGEGTEERVMGTSQLSHLEIHGQQRVVVFPDVERVGEEGQVLLLV